MEHHHHYISVMELGHLLTRSGLTYPEVFSKVFHNSFCQMGSRYRHTYWLSFSYRPQSRSGPRRRKQRVCLYKQSNSDYPVLQPVKHCLLLSLRNPKIQIYTFLLYLHQNGRSSNLNFQNIRFSF